MGAWGTAIFSDDYTMDIKKEYQALISCGVPMKEALDKTIDYFQADKENDPRFWFAIASIQCKYNILDDEVRAVTLEILNNGGDIGEWDKDSVVKRRKVLSELQKRLLDYDKSNPPLKVPKPRVDRSKWKEGDVLSYKLVNHKNAWYYNLYTGFQLVYIDRKPVSHIMPELIYDEYMHAVLFNYLGKDKPTYEQLVSSGYKPLFDNDNGRQDDFIFVYLPYRGNPEQYDRAKTAKMLYDIDVLGNQKPLGFHVEEENLAFYAYLYTSVEEAASAYNIFPKPENISE